MKLKVNLLLGDDLDNCKILNLSFIEDKVVGVASFTNTGCLINVYGNNKLEYKENLSKMLDNGLYVIIGGLIDLKLNEFGECCISNNELLNKAINYVKNNSIQYNQIKDDVLDKLYDIKIEGKKL